MKTIEDRLRTVVSLLPAAAQPRFAAPLVEGESTDTRLVEAVQALAKAEGLICRTKEELARAGARVQIATALPAAPITSAQPCQPSASDDEASALTARFAACKNPHAQTAFWRSLTPWERTVLARTAPEYRADS